MRCPPFPPIGRWRRPARFSPPPHHERGTHGPAGPRPPAATNFWRGPAGPSLRYDPLFDVLRELRREDDAQAPRGVWRSRLKLADWPAVIAQAQSALATRSKDLQLAAWLTEALAVRHGLVGTTAGLALLGRLVERYWPLLWPAAGEDAEEDARLTVLEWLDGKLAERLMLQPMAEFGEPPPSWHDQASLQRRRAGGQGRPTAEDGERQAALAKAIARTPDMTYLRMLEELRQAEAGLEGLLEALRQAGTASPPPSPSCVPPSPPWRLSCARNLPVVACRST
ncbi:ImpA family type VI secretion system protein [Siccirubricoccus deserti]